MDRRREGRRPTQQDVRLTVAGHGLRATMRNLSLSGCMVECRDIDASVGTPVEIVLLPGYVASGEIAWQLGDSFGIFFHEPVGAAVVRDFALDDWLLRGDWSAGMFDLSTDRS